MINRRKQGNKYEQLAANFLISQGIKILETNFFCKMGEIDIVCQDNDYLCFVEVKYRKNGQCGSALEAVNYGKMRKICRSADYYLLTHFKDESINVRFDVIAIQEGHLQYIKNAFEYIL